MCGMTVVLVNVKAWKSEKMVYGKRATNFVQSGAVIVRCIQRNTNGQLVLKTTKTMRVRSIERSARKLKLSEWKKAHA
jgi:hypothetical protein